MKSFSWGSVTVNSKEEHSADEEEDRIMESEVLSSIWDKKGKHVFL